MIRECQQQLALRGSTILREAMAGAAGEPAAAIAWRRYPEGEVYDPASHAQYFYHAHPSAKLPPRRGPAIRCGDEPRGRSGEEHGHFHLFLRKEGMPRGMTPLVFPETALASLSTPQAAPLRHGASDEIAHLVAISIDASGMPIRLFTTNRWVTGETWYRGADVLRMIDRFAIADDLPSPLLNRWLVALLQLYRDDLARLLEERDEAIIEWRWRWRRGRHGNVLDDARLEIASCCTIDLEARLAAIEAAALEPPWSTRPVTRPALPRMAEGWGD